MCLSLGHGYLAIVELSYRYDIIYHSGVHMGEFEIIDIPSDGTLFTVDDLVDQT